MADVRLDALIDLLAFKSSLAWDEASLTRPYTALLLPFCLLALEVGDPDTSSVHHVFHNDAV